MASICKIQDPVFGRRESVVTSARLMVPVETDIAAIIEAFRQETFVAGSRTLLHQMQQYYAGISYRHIQHHINEYRLQNNFYTCTF